MRLDVEVVGRGMDTARLIMCVVVGGGSWAGLGWE